METFWVIVGVGFILGIAIVALSTLACEKARASYKASLTQLRCNPTDLALQKQTLDLGRLYSNLIRNYKGVTVFDETALLSDINAVCGKTASDYTLAVASPSSQLKAGLCAASAHPSLEDRLAYLIKIKELGLGISKEYPAKPKSILSEVSDGT